MEDPAGVTGVPGRPGDGFVGSLVGSVGGPEANPSCAPDDVAEDDTDMFCGDVSTLADGRPIVIGGTDWYNEAAILERNEGDPETLGGVELEGLRLARIFDYDTNTWNQTGSMKYGRWYPGTVTLPDGKVLATGGTRKLVKSTQGSQVRRTETYDPATGVWTENFTGPASENTLPQNSRLFVTPNGKVLYTGHGQMWGPFGQSVDEALFGVQQFFNPETSEWEMTGTMTIPRSSPASSMLPMKAPYDTMEILTAGGVFGPPPGTLLATNTTEITTVSADGTVSNRMGPSMASPRWFGSAVPMPDGKVLILNGADKDEVVFPGIEVPVMQGELYDPESNSFSQIAQQSRKRTYHNSAVLLPDGRVLSGGNSPIATGYGAQRDAAFESAANNDSDPSFEIYSPPYLFNGERPQIDNVQSGVAWGEQFTIDTQDAGDIEKVMLMRMPAPQHVYDSDPRSLELPFTQNGDGSVTATAPPNGNIAVPGAYYLFILKTGDDGENLVPSVARTVFVGENSNSEPALEPMSGGPMDTSMGANPDPANTVLDNPPPLPVVGEAPTVPGEGGAVPAEEEEESPLTVPGTPAETPALPDAQLPGVTPSSSFRKAGYSRGHRHSSDATPGAAA